MINDPTSLLKNARFGENFEAKNRLDHENKKSPQTSKAACGLDFWRRVQDSNPRGHHCPNGFQDHPVMTASVTLRIKRKRDAGKRRLFLAEKPGFEPGLGSTPTTPLAGEPLRPLGYFSTGRIRSLIQLPKHISIMLRACQC